MMPEPRPVKLPLAQQRLSDETLIYTPGGGVCVLNDAALQVLELCDGQHTPEQIAGEFSALYPDENRETLASQATATLSHLTQHGLVRER